MWSQITVFANASVRVACLRQVPVRSYSLACLRSPGKHLTLFSSRPTVAAVRLLSTAKEGEILSSKPKESLNNKSYDPSYKKMASGFSPGQFKLLAVFISGIAGYLGLSYYIDYLSNKPIDYNYIDYSSQYLPGRVTPSKSIVREKNPGNLKITLYQYATCPFCCKVRAYLDYYGYSYDIVEVNSITRRHLNWSTYKKVPIVAVQIPKEGDPAAYEDDILQFNDSSLIISALETYRLDPSASIRQIKGYFEPMRSEDSNMLPEFTNKYFIMLHNSFATQVKGANPNEIKYEREWRKWADTKFVHVISPNIYRSVGEAIDAFKWFDEFGEWPKHFSSIERNVIIYTGALAMYFVGKKLKKKHELKEDVRQSMYDLCAEWVSITSPSKPFCGGTRMNLGDLALYGVMNSFEGCQAFTDMIENTKISSWYQACKEQVKNSKGSQYLHEGSGPVPKQQTADAQSNKSVSKRKYFYFF